MKFKSLSLMSCIILSLIGASTANADTIISVTETHYDANLRPDCFTVRMNPVTFADASSNACSLKPAGAFGPDRVTRTNYDIAGQVIKIEQAVGTSSQRDYARYTYTSNGLKRTETDANSNLTLLDYDPYDRLQKVTYPATIAGTATPNNNDYEYFSYDNNGNKTAWRRRDGQTIYYSYDALDRVTFEDQPAVTGVQTATERDVYTVYNLLGGAVTKRLESPVNAAMISYSYDALGRPTSTTDTNNRTITYQYSAAGARIRLTYPDGNFVDSSDLDSSNRIRSVTWNGGAVLFSQAFDSLGRRKKLLRGGAIAASEYSDAACAGATNATCYTYDSAGRIARISHDLNNVAQDIAWNFTSYSPVNQIISWSASSRVYDYRETRNATVSLTYDGLNRDAGLVPTSTACPSGGYDPRGNLICDGDRTFRYDLLNRLQTATGAGTNLKFIYDAEGRLAKYSTNGGNSYKTFLYDGVNLIGVYGTTGNLEERYVHGPGMDEPLVWFTDTGAQRYLWTNYQGSVITWTDASGNAGEIYKYGPYGEPLVANPWTPDTVSKSFSGARFRYTGQTVLAEASLYYYKARVYDPAIGRFLQTDPIGSGDDLDLYAYVGNDPINKIDPTGTHGNAVEVLRLLSEASKGAPAAVALDNPIAIGAGFGAMFGFGPGIEMHMNLESGKRAYEDQLKQRAREADAAGLCMSPLDPAYKYSSQFKPTIFPDRYSSSKYVIGPNDTDLQGKGVSFEDALNMAFQNTGLERSMFAPTRWARDKFGKSFPVQWNSALQPGAEVNIDWAHTENGPGVPHIGWKTGYRKQGGRSGHILIDSIPYNRGPF